ncbi:MAG: 2-C-methyl-D-erythritol 4-phosphate cytidylyltransferase [Gammaproteobacteria bacterium TMED112]|nr:MAG: 2-C-methyl-D-erythritol 4-phosphate cytidylyltransferase [Gammaproteobacteria bacterium TMED112]|tara:strand:+ start:4046 stop:5182 length:1137 start_codon:yes stop_codon:yes gene_type:complete
MKNQIKKVYAIIPSAGSGTRFNAAIPKQYFNINEELIIEKTINHFLNIDEIIKLIIPLGEQDKIFSNLDIAKNEKIQIVSGGDTRAESVLNALKTIKENSMVIVHDAVRPFIQTEMIKNLIVNFDEEKDDALVYGIPIYEALKKIDPDTLSIKKSVDRNKYYLAQTPQICLSNVLKESINFCLNDKFYPGDESEAIEKIGGKVRFLPGSRSNIKITVQEDLLNEKIGNGFDSHRFLPGDGLMIGGCKIPCQYKFDAHSDGDIVLHALIDSMLGSLGIGDIGTHFPNTEEWKDSEGEYLYKLTNEMIKEKGYSLSQIDIIVVLEEPRLNTFREKIITSLKRITGLKESNIGFKAKTSEKMGFIGKSEGAACFVMAKLNK